MPPAHHGAQAPLDGIMAELPAGPVTELDLIRLFPADDYGPVIVELDARRAAPAVERHAAIADPREPAGDESVVELVPHAGRGLNAATRQPDQRRARGRQRAPFSAELLDRELACEPSPIAARDALLRALESGPA